MNPILNGISEDNYILWRQLLQDYINKYNDKQLIILGGGYMWKAVGIYVREVRNLF